VSCRMPLTERMAALKVGHLAKNPRALRCKPPG
jgi:hypothetical protein